MKKRAKHRWAVIGAGVMAGLIIGVSLAELTGRQGPEPSRLCLVSDHTGALERIVLHYCRDFHDNVVEVFEDLLNRLDTDTEVYVVVEKRSEFDYLLEDLVRRGVNVTGRLRSVVTGYPMTPWAKDRFGTMVTQTGRPVLAVPPARSPVSGPRGNDGKVPDLLCDTLPGLLKRPLPFFFDGGDLLSDERYIFISAPMLARNRPFDVDNFPGLMSLIRKTVGREPIVLGRSINEVPDHHIGMVVTPLGHGVVAVADPYLGLELMRNRAIDTGDITVEMDTEKYRPFRNIRTMLENKGFRVVRVPMLLTNIPRVFVTYNNALLEQRNGQKRIYMPVYGIPELDRVASNIFQAEGWTVFPVNVRKVFRYTGSLRCLVGVLERKQEQIKTPGTS